MARTGSPDPRYTELLYGMTSLKIRAIALILKIRAMIKALMIGIRIYSQPDKTMGNLTH